MTVGTLATSDIAGPPSSTGITIKLDLLNFDEGFPHVDPIWVVEPIVGMGVNYNRLRLNRVDYKPFSLRGLSGVADYPTAVFTARSYRQQVGHLAVLSYTAGGQLFTFTNKFYILRVLAFPRAGAVVGAALTVPGSQALVTCQFDLQYTQVA